MGWEGGSKPLNPVPGVATILRGGGGRHIPKMSDLFLAHVG
jgi:hypothetical protein